MILQRRVFGRAEQRCVPALFRCRRIIILRDRAIVNPA
jgi:hypothetical protein